MRTLPGNGVGARQQGFTLVELMVSLLIGLLVVGAAGNLFLSNQRVFGATETIGRIQENQRAAFEMLARDVREAGGNPCTSNIVNMLDTSKPGGTYYTGWMAGVSGINGNGPGGSDEIRLSNASEGAISVTTNESPSANIGLSSNAGISSGDIMMICNSEVASIFQVTSTPSGSLGKNSGSGEPGNLKKPFQVNQTAFDASLDASNAPGYCYLPETPRNPNCLNEPSGGPAFVVRPVEIRWFLAANGRGGTSLYRQEVSNFGSTQRPRAEIAEGVTDMQITYKIGNAGNFVAAGGVGGQWGQVSTVRLQLTFQGVQGALSRTDTQGTDGAVFSRTLDDYVVLRNHQDIQ